MPAELFSPRADEIGRVVLGRSRFLTTVGATLFAAVLQATAPRFAAATHAAPPYPCYGYHPCQCCSGMNCCSSAGCYSGYFGCPTGSQCWYTCDCTQLFMCCDWAEGGPNGPKCVCSGYLGGCSQC